MAGGKQPGVMLYFTLRPGLKALSLEEKGMTQKQLAGEIGISPSRVNDYLSGRSEPTLKIARLLCRVLNIPPAAMLGF